MSIVKIEMLSSKDISVGKKLYGYFMEDKMYYDEMPLCDKYILRLFDEDKVSYGFASRETLFTEYSSRDISQAMIDTKMNFSKPIGFEVIKIESVSKNKKLLAVLKLLDDTLASKITGESTDEIGNTDIAEYLEKYDRKVSNDNGLDIDKNNSNVRYYEVVLEVKGDTKSNPKRTTISRLLKNLEIPEVSISQDEKLNFRIVYNDEFAGEVLNAPKNLTIDNVISVKCKSYIPFGYTVTVRYNPCIEENDNKLELSIKKCNAESINVVDDLSDSNTDDNTKQKYFKADKEELAKIVMYLKKNSVPDELITKILDSHEEFEEKYNKRIPHSSDENFTPWVMSEGSKNLLLLAIAQIEEGFNLRFVGGKGVGKDTLSQTLCWIYQRPRYTQSASIDTDTSILIGDKDLEPKMIGDTVVQTIGFETGLLIEAMEVGGFFELGEGNSCRPGVLMSLHTILDNRKYMDVKGYKLVKSHNRFSFILTMNVDYEGCNNLNQAFRDRFVTIKFPPPKSIKDVLKNTCSFAKESDINTCDRIYKNILNLASELQDEEVITVRGYIRTLQMAKYVPLSDALECCITNNVSDDFETSNRVRQIIENIIG